MIISLVGKIFVGSLVWFELSRNWSELPEAVHSPSWLGCAKII